MRLVVLLVALSGCATTQDGRAKQLGDALAIGGATLKCGIGEAPMVESAIAGGGVDWLGIVTELIGCVPDVVQSIVNSTRQPAKLAQLGPGIGIHGYSKRALKRARVALRVWQSLHVQGE